MSAFGLFVFGLLFLLPASPGHAAEWGWSQPMQLQQQEFPLQSGLIYIESPDTSISLAFGQVRYNKTTHFRCGGLVMLTQAYFLLSQKKSGFNYLHQEVVRGITAERLLTHHSGLPRFPWKMDTCSFTELDAFIKNFPRKAKNNFQISYTGISLLEAWLRYRQPDYPKTIWQAWGMLPTEMEKAMVKANARMVKQSIPIPCWPFCMTCPEQSLMLSAGNLRELCRQILEDEDGIWKAAMQVAAPTPIKTLKAGYGFQIAVNLKQLPLAMLSSTDQGHALFIGITPATNTCILVVADSDEPVDNLALRLMSSFHRDILKFRP